MRAAKQLLDGVVIAVPSAEAPDALPQIITADGPRAKVARNSVVEVRAFDTTWVEVYTEVPELVTSLQNRFGGKLVEA